MIELVAFLGNHGKEYERNRHNAAWLLAERWPLFPLLSWQNKFKGRYAAIDALQLPRPPASTTGVMGAEPPIGPSRIHVLMPLTYMNLSGDSVGEAAAFFKIPAERILVIHDELELPLGTASLKFSGGLGGHNGLRSIKTRLGTADFWRFRIGIGRPNHDDISGWVLSDFSNAEIPLLEQVLDAGGTALGKILSYGPEFLLPEWNKKKF